VRFATDWDSAEKQSMRSEAVHCYIVGQHIGCLLVALAYVEHAVFDVLVIARAALYGDTLSFVMSLRQAKQRLLLDAGLANALTRCESTRVQ
jgi:hypothetical protein